MEKEKEPGNEVLPDLDARPSDAWMECLRVSRPLSSGPPPAAPTLSRPADTRLRGRYLLLARLAWVAVAVLTVVCIAVSVPVEFVQLRTVCTTGACRPTALTPANARELGAMGLSAGFFAGYQVAVDLIFAATSFVVGVLIFWRKSDQRMALFVALALVTFGSMAFAYNPDDLNAVESAYPFLWLPLALVTFLGNIFDGKEATSFAAELQPDVILMDLNMPGVGGIEATRRILRTSPHIAILVISMFEDDDSVFAALQAGARGYLLKGALKAEILRSIRAVSSGRPSSVLRSPSA